MTNITMENYDKVKADLKFNFEAVKSPNAPSWLKPCELEASHARTKMGLDIASYLHFSKKGGMDSGVIGLFGPPGAGKSTIVKEVANILGLPYVNVSLSGDTVVSELLGSTELTDGNTGFYLSRAATILAYGGVLELAEINLPRADALGDLNSILDGNSIIDLPNAQTIKRHPLAFVVGTCNLNLEGTKTMNGALKDRMQPFYEVDFPKKELLKEIVLNNLGTIETKTLSKEYAESDVLDSILDCFLEMRRAKTQSFTSLEDSVTIRWLITWCRMSEFYGSVEEAFKRNIMTACNFEPDNIKTLIGIHNQYFATLEDFSPGEF